MRYYLAVLFLLAILGIPWMAVNYPIQTDALVTAIEQAGLWITDIEILRLHYAETCRIWRERFMADPDIPTMFDARFRRMWEFYLAGAELGFRHGGHMVFQIQLAKKRDATPLTRDYLLKA